MNALAYLFPTQKQCLFSIIILISMLFSVGAHTSHFDVNLQSIESQHCQYCQQNIDSPNVSIQIVASAISSIELPKRKYYQYLPGNAARLGPPLRAPPVFCDF
jgi:hypothetical protein